MTAHAPSPADNTRAAQVTQGGATLSPKARRKRSKVRVRAWRPDDIAGIIALGTAIDFVQAIGIEGIAAHEAAVLAYAMRAMRQVPGLRLIGTAARKASVLTFTLEGAHPQDVGTMLDLDGIAIRTGHHCAMPLHERLGLDASAPASIGVYTTAADIDALVASLHRVAGMFQ